MDYFNKPFCRPNGDCKSVFKVAVLVLAMALRCWLTANPSDKIKSLKSLIGKNSTVQEYPPALFRLRRSRSRGRPCEDFPFT